MFEDHILFFVRIVKKGCNVRTNVDNVGTAIINHPPFITIFMGGINHQKWVVYLCYTHIMMEEHVYLPGNQASPIENPRSTDDLPMFMDMF